MTTFKPPLNVAIGRFFHLLQRTLRNFIDYLFLRLLGESPLSTTLCPTFCACSMLSFSKPKSIKLCRVNIFIFKNYKFKDCVVPSLKNNRRYFIHYCLHYIQWRNTLRNVHKLAGTWAQTVDIFRCAMLLKRTISTFATKEKKWFTLNPIKITNFRLLW